MYNAERYIAECLDGLLAQTFKNFEVIIVDDCSIDSSPVIVESYASKFNGRLTLSRMETNSGSGALPRNKGFGFSCGEYVFFMDADDVITKTALEEMYTLAEAYDADVVYCERYFTSTGLGQDFVDNIRLADSEQVQKIPPVDKPTLETQDMPNRVTKAMKYQYWVTPWLRLVSRNLLLNNGIKFQSLIGSNDVAWSLEVSFCAKRLLRIPNPCYIRRVHDASTTFRRRTTAQHVHKWMDRTIRSLKNFDDFMAGLDFFQENPVWRYLAVSSCVQTDFHCIFKECEKEPLVDLYNIFREKFGDYLGKHDVLVAALCVFVIFLQKTHDKDVQEFNALAAQAQEQVNKFNQFAEAAQARIAELEAEVERFRSRAKEV